jgi:hypothetical protein
MPACLIGMEACVGAHHLSRRLSLLGHDARLMPAKYVRPYSKGQKNDFRDAEAIADTKLCTFFSDSAAEVSTASQRSLLDTEEALLHSKVAVARSRRLLEAVMINFVGADVHEVISSVLGDTLKLNYAIDPKVQGTVTFRTMSPILKSDLLGLLEDMLALAGVAMVPQDGGYNIIPLDQASKVPPIFESAQRNAAGRNPSCSSLAWRESPPDVWLSNHSETMRRNSQNSLSIRGSAARGLAWR